jgi:hypothetical protein
MIKSELAGSGSGASTALRLEPAAQFIKGIVRVPWASGQHGCVAGPSTATSDFREEDRLLLGSDGKA